MKPQDVAVGTVAGLIATAPMTLVMELLHDRLPRHQQHALPPRKITMRSLEKIGQREHVDREEHRTALTLGAHFGYGAAMGALYAPLATALGVSGLPSGIVFGLAVWTISYVAALPALGLFPPAHRHAQQRNLLMIVAHVVWGGALGSLVAAQEHARE
jgi:putative membrane protein